jgi:beta-lactamase class A
MASTMKVAVAATYLSYVENGQRSLDETIAGRSAASLMKAMIVRSDNQATDLLLRNLGGPRTVQKWLEWNNVEGIRVDRTIAQLLRAKRDLYEDLDSTTPIAFATFLKRLDKGELLQPWSRNYLLALMAQCKTGSNRMKALLPAGSVAHKTGTLNGYSSDVGFITLPNGHKVAIAIFARGGSNRPQAIAEAARAVYDGFRAVIGWPYNAASALTQ